MALIKLLCRHFRTTNSSEAIYKGIAGFLSNSAYGKRMDDFALHQILSIEERKTNKKYSVRISSELKQILEDTIVVDTIYNGVSIILANYLYYSKAVSEIVVSPDENKIGLPEDIQVNKSMYLLRLLGSKWNKKMQYAIRKILSTSKKEWEIRIEVFAGALVQHFLIPHTLSTRYLRHRRVVVSQQCHRIASFLRLALTKISSTKYMGIKKTLY